MDAGKTRKNVIGKCAPSLIGDKLNAKSLKFYRTCRFVNYICLYVEIYLYPEDLLVQPPVLLLPLRSQLGSSHTRRSLYHTVVFVERVRKVE